MNLLQIQDGELVISPEALMIKQFKRIWDSDRTKSKEKALKELAFVYFFADPRSNFQTIQDKKDREHEVRNSLDIPDKWKVDSRILETISTYEQMTNVGGIKLIRATRIAVDKISTMMEELDPDERGEKGTPIRSLSSIIEAAQKIPALARELVKAEQLLAREITDSTRARKGQVGSVAEDGY